MLFINQIHFLSSFLSVLYDIFFKLNIFLHIYAAHFKKLMNY